MVGLSRSLRPLLRQSDLAGPHSEMLHQRKIQRRRVTLRGILRWPSRSKQVTTDPPRLAEGRSFRLKDHNNGAAVGHKSHEPERAESSLLTLDSLTTFEHGRHQGERLRASYFMLVISMEFFVSCLIPLPRFHTPCDPPRLGGAVGSACESLHWSIVYAIVISCECIHSVIKFSPCRRFPRRSADESRSEFFSGVNELPKGLRVEILNSGTQLRKVDRRLL